MRTGRALRQLPFVAEQVREEAVAPLRRRRGPGDFQAAGDGVATLAGAEATLPAEALLLDVGRFRSRPHQRRIARAVRLAEGVAAGDQRDGLLVVHRHAGECLADVPRRRDRIRIAVRAFRIDVDQAHLDGSERIREIALSGIARVVTQPGLLGAPVDVQFRFPDVLAPAAEAEGLEAHRFQGDVARENDEVGPGDLPAVLLLDRPEQAARLVEVDVVRPAVERSKSLVAVAGAATAVTGAVRAGAVPRHANEQAPVVTEIRRPPVLRVGHQRQQIFLHGCQVEALELFGVVEVPAHRIRQRGMLVQDVQPQLVRPPVTIRRTADMIERALRFGRHGLVVSLGWSLFCGAKPTPALSWRQVE